MSASLPVEKVSEKCLFIGTVDTLFGDDDDNIKNCFDDGVDGILNAVVHLYESHKKRSLIPDNMLHYVQFSASEQEQNKCKSMIRLRDTKTSNYMKRRIAEFFFLLNNGPSIFYACYWVQKISFMRTV